MMPERSKPSLAPGGQWMDPSTWWLCPRSGSPALIRDGTDLLHDRPVADLRVGVQRASGGNDQSGKQDREALLVALGDLPREHGRQHARAGDAAKVTRG